MGNRVVPESLFDDVEEQTLRALRSSFYYAVDFKICKFNIYSRPLKSKFSINSELSHIRFSVVKI